MLTFVKVRILEEIILSPVLRSSDVTMNKGKQLLAAAVIFFKMNKVNTAESADWRWLCLTLQQGKHEKLFYTDRKKLTWHDRQQPASEP